MKKCSVLFLMLGLLATQAPALTVAGTVDGTASADTRVSGWVVSPYGQPVQEIVSVPVQNGRFSLEVPTAAPTARAQVALTPQNVSWPGVIDPVSVSGQVQVAELRFFTYRDQNNNGRRDEAEPLREVSAQAGRATLFIAWVNGDATVKANKGYVADLKRGWNAFLVEVGRAVSLKPFAADIGVTVRLGK
ncbi:hypothetical protein [Deinococcus navajonensis]|uniref:Carboxypeptidase regulatory-like domain-containing protein n=1 Tax=Deinococcus navajonensis TaxID=309884 RepID=A0ABV8XL39_9DEIO